MKHQALIALFLTLGSLLVSPMTQAQTVVCMNTNLGEICMELLEGTAPQTSANFLRYVDSQRYNNTLVHAAQRGLNSTVSGGAFTSAIPPATIAADAAITSEYSLKNLRGTVAMAVQGTDANTATSAWFINVTDNPSLDGGLGPNGTLGTTVFARIVGNGMDIVDVMTKLPTLNLDANLLPAAPVVTMDKSIGAEDLINVIGVSRFNGTLADYEASLNEDGSSSTPNLTEVVCVETNLGEFCIQMFTEDAPQTVANFLNYVRNGNFNNTFIHRSVPGFVIQAGGFLFDNAQGPVAITKNAPVVNEFKRSNTQGTLAMAKLEGNPDSATNEWFINLFDNSANLDGQNGGFTVFAQVAGQGMSIVERIARVPVYDLASTFGNTFNNVPLVNTDGAFSADDFVSINRVFETQRDLTLVDESLDPNDPASRVTALTSYFTGGFSLPIRFNGTLYQFIMREQSLSPPVYRVDTLRIIQLVDTGRPSATYADGTLKIPSIRIGAKVYTNIVLTLTNPEVLEFTLVSYDKL